MSVLHYDDVEINGRSYIVYFYPSSEETEQLCTICGQKMAEGHLMYAVVGKVTEVVNAENLQSISLESPRAKQAMNKLKAKLKKKRDVCDDCREKEEKKREKIWMHL
jgi:hypothetical protein